MKFLKRLFIFSIVWRVVSPAYRPRFKDPQHHPFRVPGTTVFVGDQEFLVRELGDPSARPVLLIHGLAGSSAAEWYQIAPGLAEDRRVIMVDHRSHGLSPQARQRFEVEDVADDIAGVLDSLGVGAVDVVGYSLGGAIAQSFAHRYPKKVLKLVLIATFSHHPQPYKVAREIGVLVARAWERLTGLGTPEVRAGYLLATGAVKREHGEWLWEETHRRDVDAGAEATRAMLRFDSRPWIRTLGVETMVVIPLKDQLVPVDWQRSLAESVGATKVVELEETRHEAPWTNAQVLLGEIDKFLD